MHEGTKSKVCDILVQYLLLSACPSACTECDDIKNLMAFRNQHIACSTGMGASIALKAKRLKEY